MKYKQMKKSRSGCPISGALDLLGDSWTILVLRDILFRHRRKFSLIAAEEGIASNILTERLARLEREGFVLRTPDPCDGRKKVITPTGKAWELTPILLQLGLFGEFNQGVEEGPYKRLWKHFITNPDAFLQDVQSTVLDGV